MRRRVAFPTALHCQEFVTNDNQQTRLPNVTHVQTAVGFRIFYEDQLLVIKGFVSFVNGKRILQHSHCK